MPARHDRRWLWSAIGYGVFLAVVAAVTASLYTWSAPTHRAMVVRLAVLFVVGVVLVRMRRFACGDPRWEPPSDFDAALTASSPVATLDREFLKRRKEVEDGIASRGYFGEVLWPRLSATAAVHDGRALAPPLTGLWRRGLRRAAIADVVRRIEAAETDE
jgi:hypothetical protein